MVPVHELVQYINIVALIHLQREKSRYFDTVTHTASFFCDVRTGKK